MFASATKAKLQEIGPRFTLKLRWLRKGLPAVTAADGSVPRGGDAEEDDVDEEELARQEKADEDVAMEEMGKGIKPPSVKRKGGDPDLGIPPLDEEQEYEWKWKVSPSLVHLALLLLTCSPRWRSRGVLSSFERVYTVHVSHQRPRSGGERSSYAEERPLTNC